MRAVARRRGGAAGAGAAGGRGAGGPRAELQPPGPARGGRGAAAAELPPRGRALRAARAPRRQAGEPPPPRSVARALSRTHGWTQ